VRDADPRVALLVNVLDRAYARVSWHGTNLRGSIRGVGPARAAKRPAPGRHNIWELAVHCAYWKYAVWRRLTGATRGSFPLKGSNWFVRDGAGGLRAWQSDVALLDRMHRDLRRAVAGLRPRDLTRRAGSQFTVADLVAGAAAHDLYHAGQIQLVKRLTA
jgi:DinB superfamily